MLNLLDDLDSKVNGIRSHLDREGNETSGWTSYHRFYERYFYRTPTGETSREEPRPGPDAAPPKTSPAPERKPAETAGHARREASRPLSHSLGDQLRGKSLELFTPQEEGSNDVD